ncbi:MAG: SOS response-associated peptidase [Phycisphaerae bacterium]|nr:SOS response-associated peptidase [Phycisphaerae bacterium]NUQ45006.1 SOS response-associated peptidase [Phycisphaerae bacterium]
MCGRYTITESPRQLAIRFQAELDERLADLPPRYNVAPTQIVPIVRFDDGRRVTPMRWGLVPAWADDPAIGNRLINARGETLASKASFRTAFRKRRCLVPADGFYEWPKSPRGKTPMRIALADGGVFAFAGLWERWTGPAGDELLTFTIVTTDANEKLKPIHDRMPVILEPASEERWLDPQIDPAKLKDLIRPAPPDRLVAYAVSKRVNSPKNDEPSLIRPANDGDADTLPIN